MFILYAADLEDVAAKHSVNIHGYADDTTPTVHQLESCITDVSQWMSANRLKLNTDKTELLWAGPRQCQSCLIGCGTSLQVGADNIMQGWARCVRAQDREKTFVALET